MTIIQNASTEYNKTMIKQLAATTVELRNKARASNWYDGVEYFNHLIALLGLLETMVED